MDVKTLISKFSKVQKVQNEDTLKIYLYGYLTEIILSKELFKNNKDLALFFESINFEHKKYLYASRTLLIAKSMRIIQQQDFKNLVKTRNSIYTFLSSESEDVNPKKANKETDDYIENILNKYSRGK